MTTEARPTVGLGDYVMDDYGRVGRVTAVHRKCPENDLWLNGQEKPSPREGRWLSILVHGGGSVAMHEHRVYLHEPFEFENPWNDFYFSEATA